MFVPCGLPARGACNSLICCVCGCVALHFAHIPFFGTQRQQHRQNSEAQCWLTAAAVGSPCAVVLPGLASNAAVHLLFSESVNCTVAERPSRRPRWPSSGHDRRDHRSLRFGLRGFLLEKFHQVSGKMLDLGQFDLGQSRLFRVSPMADLRQFNLGQFD